MNRLGIVCILGLASIGVFIVDTNLHESKRSSLHEENPRPDTVIVQKLLNGEELSRSDVDWLDGNNMNAMSRIKWVAMDLKVKPEDLFQLLRPSNYRVRFVPEVKVGTNVMRMIPSVTHK